MYVLHVYHLVLPFSRSPYNTVANRLNWSQREVGSVRKNFFGKMTNDSASKSIETRHKSLNLYRYEPKPNNMQIIL